jgi:mono/diheme cytochrome c family protein
MSYLKLFGRRARLVCAAALLAWIELVQPRAVSAQEPAASAKPATANAGKDLVNSAAIAGSKEDPGAVERGGKLFGANCGGCHGVAAKGGPGAPDLVRSVLVLDDEKGILIAPVIREGRPDKGMPKFPLSETQISDIVAWLHVRTYAAGHRGTYTYGDVVTGNAKLGEVYFNGKGKCNTCHSPTGDLAGVGKKFDPFSLQSRWLHPRETRRGGPVPGAIQAAGSALATPPKPAGNVVTVTVTPASGEPVSGVLDRIDDFTVSLRDSKGQFYSFSRNGDTPKVAVHDPLKAHTEMLRQYSDADIHNMTAYLVTLK